MINEYYYKILNVKPESSLDDIRRSYRKLAKENHPDLFPKEKRHNQELKMMHINQAYMSILSYLNDEYIPESPPQKESPPQPPVPDEEESVTTTEIGRLKDPSYTYYKLGFSYYSTALEIFHSRFRLRRDGKSRKSVSNDRLLKLAIQSISYFRKSYNYFLTVVNDYPDSIWTSDARLRLNKLSKFNLLYQKICENITTDIKKLQRIRNRSRMDPMNSP